MFEDLRYDKVLWGLNIMSKGRPFDGKYSYNHQDRNSLFPAIDVHDILVKRSRLRCFLSYFGISIFLSTSFYLLLVKEVCISSIWSITLCFLLTKLFHYKPVEKESVVIMPAFGVQLETHYWSGRRVTRHFVPISKILKPVLNECVTPVTCYWSLALVLRDEEELMLVFQKLQPPVKMLVPVWKALCAAIDCRETSSTYNDINSSQELISR